MNIKTLSNKLPLGVACLFGSESASAAASAPPHDFWFWLYNLPEVVLIALVIALFMGLSWLGLGIYRRLRSGQSQPGRRSGYYVAFAGGVLGVLVAMLAAGPWKAYLYDKITALPPTAVGLPPSAYPLAKDLFTDPDPQFAGRKPETPPGALVSRANRTRHAGVNFDALNADSLALNLFDDEPPLIAVRTREVSNMQGGSVWVGQIEDYEDSEVILAEKGRALAGTVSVDGRLFEIVYVNGNTHAVREIDVSQIPPDHPPGAVEEQTVSDDAARGDIATTSTTDTTTATTASTGQVIDVLVVYTPNARTYGGGDSGIQSKILNAVAAANQAYLNSQIDISLNLVYIGLTDYTETNSMSTSRSRLVSTTDGYMDEVHTLRNQYAADLVVLVSTDGDYCGLSAVMKTVSTSFAPSALAVVRAGCLSAASFAHEVGHMQGNEHDTDNAVGYYGAYPDSYGYRVCGKFRDIMSYSCGGEPRVAYFSNPNVTYLGYPTGVAGANDTARSMNATAATVANFRGSATTTKPTVPTAPGNLAANAPTSDSVTLTWTDNAGNETGYKVQRSLDNANWSEVADLAQNNTTSFINTGLNAQTYYYRVYAYNSIGNSAYSNTASATIAAPPAADTTYAYNSIGNSAYSNTASATIAAPPAADATQPVIKFGNPRSGAIVRDANAPTSYSLTLAWTDNASDETGYKVQRSLDNVNWSEIADLTQNTTSFTNTGLSAQTYYYRVYAYNSTGNSAYSNTASTTIADSPPPAADTTKPVVKFGNPQSGAIVSGATVSVSVSATDNVGLSGLKLYINGKLVGTTEGGSLTYSWNISKLAAGSSHTLRAKAIDTSGNLRSASVSVTKK